MMLVLALLITGLCSWNAQGTKVCYENLGCFTDEAPWGGTTERPVGYVPETPEVINTRFYLDTRMAQGVEIFNTNVDAMSQTTFDPKKMTRIIVHGFVQNGDTEWMNDMSDAFLVVEDVNVIRVGWIGGSLQLDYAQSACDTTVVGAEIAFLINNILDYFPDADQKIMHCIGHSLGAHICSYIGGRVVPAIGRITGLDPAGPYYENTPFEVRLDSTDADFVDALHSDADKLIDIGMGINQVSGHVDFWPNNGLEQPGCDQNIISTIISVDGIDDGVINFVACNHMRSIHLYTESITASCPFKANQCISYTDYLQGKCDDCEGGTCIPMGFHSIDYKDMVFGASNPNNYLQTASMAPYCEYMTYVTVFLATNSDGMDGDLFVTLYGSKDNTEQEALQDEDVDLVLRPGGVYEYTAQYQNFPSDFDHVKLLWTKEEFTVFNQYLVVDKITVWADHLQKLFTFCGSSAQLDESTRYSFYAC